MKKSQERKKLDRADLAFRELRFRLEQAGIDANLELNSIHDLIMSEYKKGIQK